MVFLLLVLFVSIIPFHVHKGEICIRNLLNNEWMNDWIMHVFDSELMDKLFFFPFLSVIFKVC